MNDNMPKGLEDWQNMLRQARDRLNLFEAGTRKTIACNLFIIAAVAHAYEDSVEALISGNPEGEARTILLYLLDQIGGLPLSLIRQAVGEMETEEIMEARRIIAERLVAQDKRVCSAIERLMVFVELGYFDSNAV